VLPTDANSPNAGPFVDLSSNACGGLPAGRAASRPGGPLKITSMAAASANSPTHFGYTLLGSYRQLPTQPAGTRLCATWLRRLNRYLPKSLRSLGAWPAPSPVLPSHTLFLPSICVHHASRPVRSGLTNTYVGAAGGGAPSRHLAFRSFRSLARGPPLKPTLPRNTLSLPFHLRQTSQTLTALPVCVPARTVARAAAAAAARAAAAMAAAVGDDGEGKKAIWGVNSRLGGQLGVWGERCI